MDDALVFTFTFEGREIAAGAGQTIAAALLSAGIVQTRMTRKTGAPRGVFCGMGVCFDCLICVDGVPNQRACVTLAKPRSIVTLQRDTQ